MKVRRQFDKKMREYPAQVWYAASSRERPGAIGLGSTPHRAQVDLHRSVRGAGR